MSPTFFIWSTFNSFPSFYETDDSGKAKKTTMSETLTNFKEVTWLEPIWIRESNISIYYDLVSSNWDSYQTINGFHLSIRITQLDNEGSAHTEIHLEKSTELLGDSIKRLFELANKIHGFLKVDYIIKLMPPHKKCVHCLLHFWEILFLDSCYAWYFYMADQLCDLFRFYSKW